MPNLYPTFNLPSIAPSLTAPQQREYKPAPKFDFETGDFVRDGAGRIVIAEGKEAYMEWCVKQCLTERNTRLAYSAKIGVEIDAAVKESKSDPAAVQSAIERTITEALMVHPATEYVRQFQFAWEGSDSLHVSFVVKGRDFEEQTLEVVY